MRARFRSWWQKRSKPLTVVTITIVVVGVLAFILFGYLLRLAWTGFNSGTSQITITSASKGNYIATVSQPGKSLWDWLQLLIIPIMLVIGGFWLNQIQKSREEKTTQQRAEIERKAAEQRAKTEREIALDKQREDLLQAYLDRMSELLLEKNLRLSQPESEVRNVARVRTITILHQLDPRRIGYIFAFLRESELMYSAKPIGIVHLIQADLKWINFSQADLFAANLLGANLTGSNLSRTELDQANLSEANLTRADLSEANLYGADLKVANLSEANLTRTDLSEANLSQANLSRANLTAADLTRADLSEANLSQADLTGAIVSTEQLNRAKSLQGATMPDGSIHP